MEKWSWLMLNIGKEEGASQGKGRRQKKSINKEEVRNRKYMDRNLKKKKKVSVERNRSQSTEPKNKGRTWGPKIQFM